MTNKNFFNNINTIQDLKKEYRRLSLIYHPDIPVSGNESMMKDLNNAYEELFNMLKNDLNTKNEKENPSKYSSYEEHAGMYMEIISMLIKYKIEIEIVGTWLWVDKKWIVTPELEEILEKLEFKYSSFRKKYYIAGIQNISGNKRYKLPWNKIIELNGNEIIKGGDENKKTSYTGYSRKKKKSKLVFINCSKK
jgi:hypothetical protein